jgi:hypothetical protein
LDREKVMAKSGKTKKRSAWDTAILVAADSIGEKAATADPSVDTHSKPWTVENHFGVEKSLDPAAMKADWQEKLAGIIDMASAAAEKKKGWQIEEIEIGMAVSAEGKLLFIAKAGFEASVKVMLKRA